MFRIFIISFLLLLGITGFGQVYITKDTLQYKPKFEEFYKVSLRIFSKIESTEKVDRKLMEELSTKNQDKKNFVKRIETAKNCIKNLSTTKPGDCIYVLTKTSYKMSSGINLGHDLN